MRPNPADVPTSFQVAKPISQPDSKADRRVSRSRPRPPEKSLQPIAAGAPLMSAGLSSLRSPRDLMIRPIFAALARLHRTLRERRPQWRRRWFAQLSRFAQGRLSRFARFAEQPGSERVWLVWLASSARGRRPRYAFWPARGMPSANDNGALQQ